MRTPLVVYYRQKANLLGKAQRDLVTSFLELHPCEVIAELVEKGDRRDGLPQLRKAAERCKARGATLAIARLSNPNDLKFLEMLQGLGVNIAFCNFPGRDFDEVCEAAVEEARKREQRNEAAIRAARALKQRLSRATRTKPSARR